LVNSLNRNNRLNQTESATFSILPCWAFFRVSVFIYFRFTRFIYYQHKKQTTWADKQAMWKLIPQGLFQMIQLFFKVGIKFSICILSKCILAYIPHSFRKERVHKCYAWFALPCALYCFFLGGLSWLLATGFCCWVMWGLRSLNVAFPCWSYHILWYTWRIITWFKAIGYAFHHL
jgi:hypothetical protein